MLWLKRLTNIPTSWTENDKERKDWMLGFMKPYQRHSVINPEATSLGRATSFNRQTVSEFFNNLREVMAQYKFSAAHIYNMGERAIPAVHVPPKVIAEQNVK